MMASGLMLPSASHAQNDAFFRDGDNFYTNRDGTEGSLTNQTFGSNGYNLTNQTFGAPLGSGLLIMVMAGMGYAIVKKQEKE